MSGHTPAWAAAADAAWAAINADAAAADQLTAYQAIAAHAADAVHFADIAADAAARAAYLAEAAAEAAADLAAKSAAVVYASASDAGLQHAIDCAWDCDSKRQAKFYKAELDRRHRQAAKCLAVPTDTAQVEDVFADSANLFDADR
jgi:hypothetical protein